MVAGVSIPEPFGVFGVRACLLRELDLLFERVLGAVCIVVPDKVCLRSSAEDSWAGAIDDAVEDEEFWREIAVVGCEGPLVG